MKMQKANILLIVTDQHVKSSIGAYGSKICKTPNLDRLADEGVLFENAYTTCPVCSPARASLQTGLYPFKHGMQTNIFMHGCMVHELPDRPYLLSRRLNDAGYTSGYTGKWHLGYGKEAFNSSYYNEHIEEIDRFRDFIDYPDEYRLATGLPSTCGYIGDDFPGHGGGGHSYPQYFNYLEHLGRTQTTRQYADYFNIVTSSDDTTIDYFLVERSKNIIEKLCTKDKPWFHSLNFWGPHGPYSPTEHFFEMYKDIDLSPWESFYASQVDKPKFHWGKRNGGGWEEFQNALRVYYAYVSFIDAQIGRLIDWLNDHELLDNTHIIFTADHGDSMGIHGGLTDKSFHLYEETTSIPLIVKPAGGINGFSEKRFANTTDIYSTILDLAGLPEEQTRQHGRSLMPLIRQDNVLNWPEEVVVESSGLGPALHTSRMIRRGNDKYIFNCGGIDELYNLSDDPHELVNLALKSDSKTLLKEMRLLLKKWLEKKGDYLVTQYSQLLRADFQFQIL